MRFFQMSPGMSTQYLLNSYPWEKYTTVVDVGGSHGLLSIDLVQRFPHLRCTVQDLPEVIASAPKDVHRVEFQGHDFFTPQPVYGADVYLFRAIFHNWGDKYCVQILRNLIPALKKGARVVVNDHVVPAPGVLGCYKEQSVRGFDSVMKATFNSRERSVEDWRKFIMQTDERFIVRQVIEPEGIQLGILDVEWMG
ncbi:S-adenosyl-L-methionine-dependent methyltransferase [Sporormia fimetaria CBS 119925]|uniref:S-adenosyl-L-methionine-dependent methyltransferase n=1 Tax=Sporormia fimetaria CBS 119925 TaxID=1340428 RepID=A0A6A6V4C6_9PLEO|nr:S-adenosyl-L-methionine-dependent methyltransferase [Sporormia fimetaria CBS 119925]